MSIELSRDNVPSDPVSAFRQLFGMPEDEPVYPALQNIDITKLASTDLSHGLSHIECVQSFSKPMLKVLNINEYWRSVIGEAINLHDIDQGYSLDKSKLYGPRQEIAATIAYMLTKNRDVANVIWLHNEDDLSGILNEELVAAARIVKNADQMDLNEYRGIIRMSPYWGLETKRLKKVQERVLPNLELYDSRCDQDSGLPQDYGLKVRKFCLLNIFPFLVQTNQVEKAKSLALTNIERFFGSSLRDINFLRTVSYQNKVNEIQSGKFDLNQRKWMDLVGSIVEGIDQKYAHLFIRKPILDAEILEVCNHLAYRRETNAGKDILISSIEYLEEKAAVNPW